MNKKSILLVLLDLVFLAVFNVVFFVVGGADHEASVWIAYGFIHLAYIMVLLTQFLIRKSSQAAIFGMSLYSISTAYFFVEFVIGLIFIFIGSDSYKASLVTQIILAGAYTAILLSNMIANEHTADNVAKHEAEVAYIKNTAMELKALMGKVSDKQANKEIEKAYDTIHASPVKSSAGVVELEKKIYFTVSQLRAAVQQDDAAQVVAIAQQVTELTEERNRNLRMSN